MDDPHLLDEQVPEHRLASADSDYVSGATCFMDGGLMMNLARELDRREAVIRQGPRVVSTCQVPLGDRRFRP